MTEIEKKRLKNFLRDNFSFSDLKKLGFYSKEVRANDYEKQAIRICQYFGLDNVYDYTKIGAGANYHLSDGGKSPLVQTIKDNFGESILKSIVNPTE